MTILAVADTGPLIHLNEIDSLPLLNAVDELHLTQTVYDELEAGGTPSGFDDLEYSVHAVGSGHEREADESQNGRYPELDAGERTALTLCQQFDDPVLLTDDLAARDAAEQEGLEVHGSIGVIALASSRGLIEPNTAADCMRSLQAETSLFVSDAVVERGIELL